MVASNDFHGVKTENPPSDRAARSRLEAAHDIGLVTRFKAGDETAFNEIALRYRVRLTAVAFHLLRNRSDAEEIAQDTLIRAHRALAAFRGESSLFSWLHCIAVNLARNRYWYFHRRCRHATFSLNGGFGEDQQGSVSDFFATEELGPARQAITREFAEIVAECMSLLDEPQREVLNLRVSVGKSYEVIAGELGIKVGTVKSRVARARQTLRQLLTQVCPEFHRGDEPNTWFEANRPVSGMLATRA